MGRREIGLGIIGCGLMGRELASASARWLHLLGLDFAPKIVAACDSNPKALTWFTENVPTIRLATDDYHKMLADPAVEAVYCAVPHNLHQQFYTDIIRAGKHLLGEKPFGIDLAASDAILKVVRENPKVLVRSSSEFPFVPGPYLISKWAREHRFGKIIEVEAGFWHSSDLDPRKPINWKRRGETNGEYGCMGDLGLHVVHIPFRLGWTPVNVRAMLSKIFTERPDRDGKMVPCDTWDNAILACEAVGDGQQFPMTLSTKRIAPGQANTWFLRVMGTSTSVEFNSRNPKQLMVLDYTPGGDQSWKMLETPHVSAYESITGRNFEFGFSESILQMLAAFLDEVAHGPAMRQPFFCATPEETARSHRLFTAALVSQRTRQVVSVD